MNQMLCGLLLVIIITLFINYKYKYPIHIPVLFVTLYYIIFNSELQNNADVVEKVARVVGGGSPSIHTELPDF